MNFDEAIKAHVAWKIKFKGAMQNKESLDAETIGKDNCCPLGIWLHGDAKERFNAVSDYKTCVSLHAEFHRQAALVAAAINEKRYAAAEEMLAPESPYSKASTAVVVAIGTLRGKVAGAS